MTLQGHFSFECPLTVLALEGSVLPLLVPQQVVLKTLCVPEFSRALVAGKKFLFFVSVHVPSQTKLPVKALVADIAYKGLLFPPDVCFLHVSAVRAV